MSVGSNMISFAEIVQGRDASVRVTVDGLIYAVDLVMVVTGKDRDHASQTIRLIARDHFDPANFIKQSLPGKGRTKLVSFQHAIDLIMVLPGRLSKLYRKLFADVLIRYLDGDLSMCQEIANNKAVGKLRSYSAFAQRVLHDVNNAERSRSQEMPPTTYIYATKSDAFPGLIKIGRTVDVPKRVSQLNTGCAPAPHMVIAVAPTFDNVRDERLAQAFFAESRREGEFFEISEDSAREFFASHITAQYTTELAKNIKMVQGM